MTLNFLARSARFLTQSVPSRLATCIGTASSNELTSVAFSRSHIKTISTTAVNRSLDEFFDDPNCFGETKVKSGRPWRIDELRLKSNSDLHKLWFVLYKERNMLYTMQEAAKEAYEIFPSPERIDKVEESMANLENVVRERNDAYWQLEVSHSATGERPSVFRRDVFGRPRWHKTSQHIVPYARNFKFRNSQGPGKPSESDWFFRQYREMKRKHYNYKRARTARYIRDLLRRFPDADIDYIAELHPEFPQGYVQHLKDNLELYDDPPAKCTFTNVRDVQRQLKKAKDDRLLGSS